MDLREKDYIIIVQCDIAQQRCSGHGCENACFNRTGGFADYPADKKYRTLYFTCSGCCGKALNRKLTNAVHRLNKIDGISTDRIVVQLASCITKDNYHAPPCPNLEYLKKLIEKVTVDYREDTSISATSEKKRQQGIYEQ